METDIFGYTGKLIRVDLTSGSIEIEKPDESFYKRYLGGRGIIMHTLLNEIPAGSDPLGPENRLVFAAGLMTGHKLMGTSKSSVGAKSPLTGTCAEAEASGYWGAELRKAGYDGIIFSGISERPVFLWVHNEKIELRDAGEVWLSEVKTARAWLQKNVGQAKSRAAVIGPGGATMVKFANIIVDCTGAFGRGGIGAVMGAKKLKAVLVKGSRLPPAADGQKILQLNQSMKGKYKQSPFEKYGTGAAMKAFEAAGNLPIRNFSGGRFRQVEKIDAVTLQRDYGTGMDGCFNCPIRCKKKIEIKAGRWPIDSQYGGPEYETLAAFGSNLLVDDLQAVCKAHELCNAYGIDTISTGATIAFAMECFENGILGLEDTEGIVLEFGNAQAMIEMITKIAFRQGLGAVLSEGTQKASERLGKKSSAYAIHVKGLELPFHEPRFKQGMGLHYSIHGTGADHVTGAMDDGLPGMMGDWDSLNIGEPIPPTELSPRKARFEYEMGLWRELNNYIGLCAFFPWSISEVCEAVSAVTGWPVTTSRLMKAVERGITMMRIFNLREGFTRQDDRLPARFHESPVEGPLKEIRVDPAALKEAQEIYYQLMGWDDNGVPTRGCLVGLDLDWASACLERP